MFIFVVRSEHDHLRSRAHLLDLPRRVHPVHPWHDQIHQDNVGGLIRAEPDCFFSGTRLAYDLKVGLCSQQRADALPRDGMIVNDNKRYAFRHKFIPFY
jgi:hypothetical protein